MIEALRQAAGRPRLLIGGVIALTILSFIIAIPRSGGADEPSHMVASAALVRGQLDGDVVPGLPSARSFDVPFMVGRPNPDCWAFDPTVPAACAGVPNDSDITSTNSTAYNYPPYSYVLPGLASFVPSPFWYAYLARAMMALGAVALLAASFGRLLTRSPHLAVGAAVGLTPIAWFSMSIVNPSAIAIAGGFALWTALLTRSPARTDALLIIGWAAVILPRRDGAFWATLIVLGACLLLSRRPSAFVPRSTASRVAIAAIAALAPVTALALGLGGLNLTLALAPLGLVAVEGTILAWTRTTSTAAHVALIAAWIGAGGIGWAVLSSLRPGGGSLEDLEPLIGATSRHLEQVVGWLSWTDAPAPIWAVLLWWGLVAGLAMMAVVEFPRAVTTGVAVLAVGIVAAWLLEYGRGDTNGLYWQARYTMPLLVGLPMVLTWRPDDQRITPPIRLDVAIAATSWVVVNASFIAAMYRWGAGVNEASNPFRWIRWDSPLHPVLLIAAFVATTALFWAALLAAGRAAPESRATR